MLNEGQPASSKSAAASRERTEGEARRALAALRAILAELGLEPKDAKTRVVHLREGGEGFDFLGFQSSPFPAGT
jgi:hypothetical protein